MWNFVFVFASVVLLADAFQEVPVYQPHYSTTIECKVPGPYENGKKRFVSSPMRTVIDEPRLRLSLVPGTNPDDCWELPYIEVKEPDLPPEGSDELRGLFSNYHYSVLNSHINVNKLDYIRVRFDLLLAVFTANFLMNVALQLLNFYAIQGFKY